LKKWFLLGVSFVGVIFVSFIHSFISP
jgi:hypothetical protein